MENGHSPPPGHVPPASGPASNPPAQVAELAAACARFVLARYGVALDFSSETLPLVDRWLVDSRGEVTVRPEAIDLVQAAAGAHLGEVVRRAFGGEWVTEGNPSEWRFYFSEVYCGFNPIGMAREALLGATAEGWHAHLELDAGDREEVERRLEALPSVRDDDYYAPSTRFDVLEIVFEMLRAKMHATGLEDIRFTPDDYDG